MKQLAALVVAASLTACTCSEARRAPTEWPPPGEPALETPKCVSLYDGSIEVDSFKYVHSVHDGDEVALAPIENVDQVVPGVTKLRFTLDYPFEKPFSGELSGQITLRKIIDAIRAGFRTMYAGAIEEPIPGMMNRDVRGKYGASFHAIGDLVIEAIELCDGDRLEISIGS